MLRKIIFLSIICCLSLAKADPAPTNTNAVPSLTVVVPTDAEKQMIAGLEALNKALLKNTVAGVNKYADITYQVMQDAAGRRQIHPVITGSDEGSVVVFRRDLLAKQIIKLANGKPVVLKFMSGFSSAGYGPNFANDLKSFYAKKVQEDVQNHGAKTLFVAGGTKVGIGQIYDPATLGASPDVGLIGIVSDQAAKYPDSIAPNLDALFLVGSYLSNGSESWEVKEDLAGESENTRIFDLHHFIQADYDVFEGGEVALKEISEWLLTRFDSPSRAFTLRLFLDYEPGNAKKDTGFRGAEAIASLLMRFPNQLHAANVAVEIYTPKTILEKPMTLNEYAQTDEGKRILAEKDPAFVNKEIASLTEKLSKSPGDADLQRQLGEQQKWLQVDADLTDVTGNLKSFYAKRLAEITDLTSQKARDRKTRLEGRVNDLQAVLGAIQASQAAKAINCLDLFSR